MVGVLGTSTHPGSVEQSPHDCHPPHRADLHVDDDRVGVVVFHAFYCPPRVGLLEQNGRGVGQRSRHLVAHPRTIGNEQQSDHGATVPVGRRARHGRPAAMPSYHRDMRWAAIIFLAAIVASAQSAERSRCRRWTCSKSRGRSTVWRATSW